MDHRGFIDIINQRARKAEERFEKHFIDMIEDDYVVDSLCMNHIKNLEKQYNGQRNSELFYDMVDKELPVRKTKEFDISKHSMDGMYLHKHSFLEIDYVYKGSCKYYINSDETFTCFREKQICLLNQNMIHGIEVSDEDSIIIKCMIPFNYLEISDYQEMKDDSPLYRFLTQSISHILASDGFLLYQLEETEGVEVLLYNLFNEYVHQNIGFRTRLKNDISNLLIELFRLESDQLIQMKMEDEKVLNMAKIITYIRDHYKDVTLKAMANQLHFHENYLGRKIKDYLKKNFQEYLKEVRIEEAKKLLKETSIPANLIALEIGYRTPSFFFKAFKELEGITPIQYREGCKKVKVKEQLM